MRRLGISLSAVLKASFVLLLLNELRGIVLAVPVLLGIYHSSGSAIQARAFVTRQELC